MVVPFQVNSDLEPNRSIQFWILESRYCGASADRAGKFVAIAVPGFTREGKLRCGRSAPKTAVSSLIDVAKASSAERRASGLGCGRFSARGLAVLSPAVEAD